MPAGTAHERDLRVLSAAIGLSALGDGVALVAHALEAKNLAGDGMGWGMAISAMLICLWVPVVLLSGHVGLLVDRVGHDGCSSSSRWRRPSSPRLSSSSVP